MHRIDTRKTRILGNVDPRVKLLCAVTLLGMVLAAKSPLFPLLVAGISVAVCIAGAIGWKNLALRYAEPLLIGGVIVLLKLFFAGKNPLFVWHVAGLELTGYREGLADGLLIASRIAGAVSVVTVLAFSTEFTPLMAALSWLRIPRGLTDTTMFAWRWLFLLHDDARVVYAAQRNRLGYTGYRRSLSSLGTLAGALVIKAFDGSQAMTTAMVQRGYDGGMPLLKHRPFRSGELAGSLIFVASMAALWSL
jgi:cobalt/nickel transport system permease protein